MTKTAPLPEATAFLSTPAIALRWVLPLRWGAVAGQTATIAGTALLFHLALPILPLAVIVITTALSNLGLVRWMRTAHVVPPRLVAAVLGFDTLSLGALLFFTGGPSNPFSVLFLVQITIAALVLAMRYTMAIVALSAAVYAFLFFANVPVAGMEHAHHAGSSAFNLHLQGMFVAFTLDAILIAYFVTRVSSALRERDTQLVDAQRLAATNQRLASLSTLAAGAAHELGTPLATIAVVSKELERATESLAGAETLRDDAQLIRHEVDRCRDIVQQMGARAGSALGEASESIAVERIVSELRSRLADSYSARLEVRADGVPPITVPWRGLVQTLGLLLKNAFDASEAKGTPVVLAVEHGAGRVRFAIVDEGTGMTADEVARAGEPFFTTKPPGAGMGLGVFLARTFAEQLGGELRLTSEHAKGTRAVLELPAAAAHRADPPPSP